MMPLPFTKSGADALGFIFYPKSSRYVFTGKGESRIIENIPGEITRVGVFVNHRADEIKEIVEILQPQPCSAPRECKHLSTAVNFPHPY